MARTRMKLATYRTLQAMAASLCAFSTVAFSQTSNSVKPTLAGALLAVGWGDWAVTALVSLSFGLVSLLQRFKTADAGAHYWRFVTAHMSGSLVSGVTVYLVTQAAFDAPNRFVQALMIGAAGWSGSTIADAIAQKINRQTMKESKE